MDDDYYQEAAGKTVTCPQCQAMVFVPALPNPGKSPKAMCPKCNGVTERDDAFCVSCGMDLRKGRRMLSLAPLNNVKQEQSIIPNQPQPTPSQDVITSYKLPWWVNTLIWTIGLYFTCWLMLGHPIWPFNKTTSSDASGEWILHFGVDVEKLYLTDTDGVIKGTITKDTDFGGKPINLHGMRVGQDIEIDYSAELTTVPGDKCNANYALKGRIDGNNMSGNCKVLVITASSDGDAGGGSSETLWKAERN